MSKVCLGEMMIGVSTKILGRKIIYFQEIDSTNEYAKRIAMEEEEGTLIIADVQRKGHGRRSREWASPRGGIWMSVILKPDVHPRHLIKIVFVGAVAVVEALEALGVEARIKWPNDILVNGKKICGILAEGKYSESKVDYIILGVGLNINVDKDALPPEATSLKEILGVELPLMDVFKVLIGKLEHWYGIFKRQEYDILFNRWRSRAILNRKVRILSEEGEFEGIAWDVDEDGALIVETPDGKMEKVIYGDVSLRYA